MGKKVLRKFTATQTPVAEDQILDVWNTWLQFHAGARGRAPQLSESRRAAISYAIGAYGLELSRKAIEGCSLSEFHMGGNDLGKKYNSIELIFRDEWRVKKFASLVE